WRVACAARVPGVIGSLIGSAAVRAWRYVPGGPARSGHAGGDPAGPRGRALRGSIFRKAAVTPMFAVIRTGGKQYKVAKDDVIQVEKLAGEPGDSVTLDVLMVGGGDGAMTVGSPLVAGASVSAEV